MSLAGGDWLGWALGFEPNEMLVWVCGVGIQNPTLSMAAPTQLAPKAEPSPLV